MGPQRTISMVQREWMMEKTKPTYKILHISPEVADEIRRMARINHLTQSELLEIMLVYGRNLKITAVSETKNSNPQYKNLQRIRKLTWL